MNPEERFEPGPAADRPVSLAQAILAPVDALLKAQVHATRSFLNLLLQMGTPHQVVDAKGKPSVAEKVEGGLPYQLEFPLRQEIDGQTREVIVTIPTLALVPLKPLSISKGRFRFSMAMEYLEKFRQIAASKSDATQREAALSGENKPAGGNYDEFNRPWHLVNHPVSIVGRLAPRPADDSSGERSTSATIEIEVEVEATAIPEPLDNLLSTMGKAAAVRPPPAPADAA